MSVLNINVERTGFPIKIAGLEFFFDSSIEGINDYNENYLKALDELNKLELANKDDENELLEERIEIYRKSYDIILGEGAFDKIYKKIKDIIALEKAFFDIVNGIDMHVKIVVDEYSERTNQTLSEYEDKFK